MKTITFDSAHRRRHFDFFSAMDVPYFSVTAPLSAGPLVELVKARGLRLHVATVYLVADAANRVPELRRRIRGDAVVEHEVVHPSFSVATDEADVFSFCEVKFVRPFAAFAAEAEQRMERMRTAPVFADDPGRDDYLFLSAFPWTAFTAVTQPVPLSPPDSVPRIVWGKVSPAGLDGDGPLALSVSIQAHHAVVDGRHLARFFELLQSSFRAPAAALG
jgi:chloramphenicol O-acetyltransferase type A